MFGDVTIILSILAKNFGTTNLLYKLPAEPLPTCHCGKTNFLPLHIWVRKEKFVLNTRKVKNKYGVRLEKLLITLPKLEESLMDHFYKPYLAW